MSTEDQFERRIRFQPAFDKRDPNPKKNYGIHGVEITFELIGQSGAVVLSLFTPWYLDSVDVTEFPKSLLRFQSVEIQFHSKERITQFQKGPASDCGLLDGGLCYWDGSPTAATFYFRILREQGSDGLWKALEDYYYQRFPLDSEMVVEGHHVLVKPHDTFNETLATFGALLTGKSPEEFWDDMQSETPLLDRLDQDLLK